MKTIKFLIFSVLLVSVCSCRNEVESFKVYKQVHGLEVAAYPAHVEFSWDSSQGESYDLYLKSGRNLKLLNSINSSPYLDWSVKPSKVPTSATYYVIPKGINPKSLSRDDLSSMSVTITIPAATDEALLDMTQKYTTRYFHEFADHLTGMAKERSNSTNGAPVTTGGTGFGIMALIAGIERGYLSTEQGYGDFEKILNFLENIERFHGAWAHWYDPQTRKVHSFSKYDDGGDLVETAFLVEGLITLKQYLKFKRPDLCVRADRLVRGVEWNWYTGEDGKNLYWHWSKNYGWKMNHRIKGYDETFITYVLAASSQRFGISREVYENCYKNSDYYYNGKSYYGLVLPLGMNYGGPLFFTHYSWLGLDPRGLTDGKVNYFEQNRTHALIHYNYALENPMGHKGLGADFWGFTSSDDMLVGYTSHHPMTDAENGTVSPTAPISSIVYTPEESLACLRHLYYDMGSEVFGPMGFYDAVNLSLPQGQKVVKSYLAIDQGPIAVMIENYRSGLLWELFMSAPEIRSGLEKLGFYYESK